MVLTVDSVISGRVALALLIRAVFKLGCTRVWLYLN